MAKFKPKLPIVDQLLTQKPGNAITEISNVASKAMRFKVLLDRETRGFQKADINGSTDAYEFEGTKPYQPIDVPTIDTITGYTSEKIGRQQTIINAEMTDRISIIDIDSSTGPEDPTSYDYITLPFVPRELNYSTKSKFVGIATLGRNNPYYQFTGSEDILKFDIDWFSYKQDRTDVINNCRWLEALTKADGWNNPPHRIILSWGANNLLWQDSIWIVISAPFKLSDFNRGYRKINTDGSINPRGEFISTSMLPQQAHQSITLKRVTSINRSREEISKAI